MGKRNKRRRKRVSKDDVRKNAKKGGGGGSWFILPDGVEEWAPEKKGKYRIDVVPYEVTDSDHPDEVEEGSIWYKRMFVVHHNIGPENKSIVCPRSVKKKCPVHEERDRISSDNDDGDSDDIIKKLKGQTYCAMNILDPEDSDRIKVFCMSTGKFWSCDAGLKTELLEADDENLSFYDTEGGKTLKVRFSDDSFAGHAFIKATKVEFEDRDDMNEDKTLAKTVNLDEFLNVLPYEKLKTMFLQEEGDDDSEDKPKKNKKEKKKDKGKKLEKADPPKKEKKGKGKKKKCPGGGKFGRDFEKFDECDECPHWDACEEAHDD